MALTLSPLLIDDLIDREFSAEQLRQGDWIGLEVDNEDGGHAAYCHPDNAPMFAAVPELVAALRAFSAAFPPTLHRNGAQTAAITAARDLLERLDA